MLTKTDRCLDQTGLNLIRIVIGSYFLAISLDLIGGVSVAGLFLPLMDEINAQLAGSSLIFVLSVLFMCGLQLRLISLMLALFVLCASLIENFLYPAADPVSYFWRDLTLCCAVLMSYSALSRDDMRRAAVVWKRPVEMARESVGDDVTPRRVNTKIKKTTRPTTRDSQHRLRPLISPTHPVISETKTDIVPAADRDGAAGALAERPATARVRARHLDTELPAEADAPETAAGAGRTADQPSNTPAVCLRQTILDALGPIEPEDDCPNIFANI